MPAVRESVVEPDRLRPVEVARHASLLEMWILRKVAGRARIERGLVAGFGCETGARGAREGLWLARRDGAIRRGARERVERQRSIEQPLIAEVFLQVHHRLDGLDPARIFLVVK